MCVQVSDAQACDRQRPGQVLHNRSVSAFSLPEPTLTLDDFQTEAKRTAPRELKAYPESVRLAYEALRVQAVNEEDDRGPGAGDYTKRQAKELLETVDVLVWGLGLAGEAGEVDDLLKKGIGHGHGIDNAKLTKELGDVMWYVANIATARGIKLSDVATANVAKLKARYPSGFTVEASKAKADETFDTAPVIRIDTPTEQVTKWADPDAAYQRVFNKPRVEKTMFPAAEPVERCLATLCDSMECPGSSPCLYHECTVGTCFCRGEEPTVPLALEHRCTRTRMVTGNWRCYAESPCPAHACDIYECRCPDESL